jgi:hypothetical protein
MDAGFNSSAEPDSLPVQDYQQPEVKADVVPEVQAEVQPEVQPEVQADAVQVE